MPKVALPVTFQDWEGLLQAAEPYGHLKDLELHLGELRSALDTLRALEAERGQLRARRQRATQELHARRDAGKVVAIQIRSILRGILGHDSELLVQFNMTPRRRRRAAGAKAPVPSKSPE
jgi:phage terminase Nu1 subunit (DNA packaging protein)